MKMYSSNTYQFSLYAVDDVLGQLKVGGEIVPSRSRHLSKHFKDQYRHWISRVQLLARIFL